MCRAALEAAGYDDELIDVVEADEDEVGDIIAAVEGSREFRSRNLGNSNVALPRFVARARHSREQQDTTVDRLLCVYIKINVL